MIAKHVDYFNFKQGRFRQSIKKDTPPHLTIRTIVNSPHMNNEEADILRAILPVFENTARWQIDSIREVRISAVAINALMKVLETDAIQRGYIQMSIRILLKPDTSIPSGYQIVHLKDYRFFRGT